MYSELIKRLREHKGWALNKTLDEAADVIEELSKGKRQTVNEDKIKELVSFAHFVAKEVFQDDDYWELNYGAFPELACRKLYKLGIVEKSNGVWHYNPSSLNDSELCSRAECGIKEEKE